MAQLARASALHAEGRRFDSDYLHQHNIIYKIDIVYIKPMECSSVGEKHHPVSLLSKANFGRTKAILTRRF